VGYPMGPWRPNSSARRLSRGTNQQGDVRLVSGGVDLGAMRPGGA
jgi:hypothetical protein